MINNRPRMVRTLVPNMWNTWSILGHLSNKHQGGEEWEQHIGIAGFGFLIILFGRVIRHQLLENLARSFFERKSALQEKGGPY